MISNFLAAIERAFQLRILAVNVAVQEHLHHLHHHLLHLPD